MDASVALLAAASFIGGLLVTSRVIAWVTLLVLYFKPPAGASHQPGSGIAPLVLHSGPWVLVIAVGAVSYAASSSRSAHVWAVVGGLGMAVALIAGVTVQAVRRARASVEPPPLTPERFLVLRRRFFWRNSLFFAVAVPVVFALFPVGEGAPGPGLLLVVCVASFLGGWAWSWFMWQWYGEALKVNEKARLQRQRNAV